MNNISLSLVLTIMFYTIIAVFAYGSSYLYDFGPVFLSKNSEVVVRSLVGIIHLGLIYGGFALLEIPYRMYKWIRNKEDELGDN